MGRSLILVAALVPALSVAAVLLAVTALREHAHRLDALSDAQALEQGITGSQRLAADLQAARAHDREQQRLAVIREQQLREHLAAVTRELAQDAAALQLAQSQLQAAHDRISALQAAAVVQPPGAPATMPAPPAQVHPANPH